VADPPGGFNPGPWSSGGFLTHRHRRYRAWHLRLSDSPYDYARIPEGLAEFGTRGVLLDAAWGIMISDRVSPRASLYLLDHVPQLRVATY
jgi:hypothetical protein